MLPDAVIQQNYGEDDTESNLVTDKLDEKRRRPKRHTKNELWYYGYHLVVDRTMYEKLFLSISLIQQNSLVLLFIGLAQISYITMYLTRTYLIEFGARRLKW